ncbi:hypothetical protein AKJ53_01490 [candidate division MSBL1 archaeon SCGC-AAA382F02]|uniref:C2H2-type domain-containing protein n=1 Tax=candidate division MSBL1 archaeon SCGC-AAA382F02 TaxID=1698282 RepID=A0A133VHU6_9EURY|nr:hypothetical protein AKJ53_01490 [candidate division MSBL1 archaeon SCGC-AAA382F02]
MGYDDWDKYEKDHKKIQTKAQNRKRREAGFTRALKEKIKERDDHRCSKCGSSENLEVHHKDGDFRNNDEDNLATVCKSCHEDRHKKESSPKKKPSSKKPLTPREKGSFATCPTCGKRLANEKAVKRHIENWH